MMPIEAGSAKKPRESLLPSSHRQPKATLLGSCMARESLLCLDAQHSRIELPDIDVGTAGKPCVGSLVRNAHRSVWSN